MVTADDQGERTRSRPKAGDGYCCRLLWSPNSHHDRTLEADTHRPVSSAPTESLAQSMTPSESTG